MVAGLEQNKKDHSFSPLMNSTRQYRKFMISRTTIWLRVAYLIERFECESFFCCLSVLSMLPFDEDTCSLTFLDVVGLWGIIALVSVVCRVRAAQKNLAPHFLRVKELVHVEPYGWEFEDRGGEPCVRVRIQFDTFSAYSLKDRVGETEFMIFTYLDLPRRVSDLKDFTRHLLETVPCREGSVPIGGGDSYSTWRMPTRYRTPWGVVKSVN